MQRECKKPCDPAKICNPASGRCVLRTGKIGMSLLSKGPKAPNKNSTSSRFLGPDEVLAALRRAGAFGNVDPLDAVYRTTPKPQRLTAELAARTMRPGDTQTLVTFDFDSEWNSDLFERLAKGELEVLQMHRPASSKKLRDMRNAKDLVRYMEDYALYPDNDDFDKFLDSKMSDVIFVNYLGTTKLGTPFKSKQSRFDYTYKRRSPYTMMWLLAKKRDGDHGGLFAPGRYANIITWVR